MTEPLSTSGQNGPKKTSEIEDEFRHWGMQLPTVGGCLFCPDFRPTGTATEVKLECEDHRATAHPEIVYKKRRRRPHANPAVLSFRQSLTEDEEREIDDARAKRMKLLGIDP